MEWFPFLLYVFVTSFTPGPNNMMSMVSATRFGYRQTLRFISGVAIGTAVIAAACSFFQLLLAAYLPSIKFWLSILGACYMVYLAVKLLRAKPDESRGQREKGNSFFAGLLLQFVNPKVILYGITTVSTFILPFYHSRSSLFLFSLLLGFVGFLSTSSWAIFGALFQKWLAKYHKAFHTVMGLLLLYCAVLIFSE